MDKNILLSLVFLFFLGDLSAQKYYAADGNYDYRQENKSSGEAGLNNLYFALNYSAAAPLSKDFKNFISDESLYGASFEVHYLINENFSVGGELTYQSFGQKFSDMLSESSDGFEKATQFRKLLFIDALVKSRYYINHSENFFSYIGLGIGGTKILAEKEVSRYMYSDSDTNLLVKPELGIMFKLTQGLFFNATYSYNGIWRSFSSDTDLSYSKLTFGIVIK